MDGRSRRENYAAGLVPRKAEEKIMPHTESAELTEFAFAPSLVLCYGRGKELASHRVSRVNRVFSCRTTGLRCIRLRFVKMC